MHALKNFHPYIQTGKKVISKKLKSISFVFLSFQSHLNALFKTERISPTTHLIKIQIQGCINHILMHKSKNFHSYIQTGKKVTQTRSEIFVFSQCFHTTYIVFFFFAGRLTLILFGIFTLILGIILSSIPWLDYLILKNLRLWNGTLSFHYWQKPGVIRLTKVYIFNITNNDSFINYGEKPKLTEIGPFVYR